MKTSRRIAIGLVLVLAACFSLTQLAEVDFFWHLLAGERILAEQRVPRADTFTFTSTGRPWVDLHWLFQAALAWVFGAAGWAGVDLLKVGLLAGGVGCACLAALERTRSATVPALALVAVLAAQERFTLRPEAASFLLLGVVLLCLERRHARPGLLAVVPPLIALWANLHALYAVGVGILFLVLAGDLVAWRWARRDPSRRDETVSPAPLALAAAAAVPASLLTPYGLSGWALPGQLLFERVAAHNLYGRTIAEFQAPFSHFGRTAAIIAFALLALLVLGSCALGWRRLRPADGLALTAFLALALLARRNIPLFALVAIPCAAPAVDAALKRGRDAIGGAWSWKEGAARLFERLLAGLVAVIALVGIIDVVTNRFFERDGTQRHFGSGPAPGLHPEAAAGFLARLPIQGEVLNDMTMGGYLAWRWYPGRRVFIDGRLEVHDATLYADYLRLQRDPEAFEAVARRFGVGAVIWSHLHGAEAAPMLRHLAAEGSGWRPVFVDLAAAVFVREPGADGPPPAIDLGDPALASRLLEQAAAARLQAAGEDPLPRWLRRVLPRRDVPVAVVSAALFFAILDRHATAERLFRAALGEAPDNAALHYDLGVVLDRAGRPDEARRSLETAVRLDRSMSAAHAALGIVLWRGGDEQGALAEWRAAERGGALPAAALQARGALHARRGAIDEAIEDYREALRAAPDAVSLRADLALLYHRRGFREQAMAEIRRATAADPRACAPRVAGARLRGSDGAAGEAEALYRAALADDPGCAAARVGLAALLMTIGRQEDALREVTEAVRRGADPLVVSAEPSLRTLVERPEVRAILKARSAGARDRP